jgi:hypothetical protein
VILTDLMLLTWSVDQSCCVKTISTSNLESWSIHHNLYWAMLTTATHKVKWNRTIKQKETWQRGNRRTKKFLFAFLYAAPLYRVWMYVLDDGFLRVFVSPRLWGFCSFTIFGAFASCPCVFWTGRRRLWRGFAFVSRG